MCDNSARVLTGLHVISVPQTELREKRLKHEHRRGHPTAAEHAHPASDFGGSFLPSLRHLRLSLRSAIPPVELPRVSRSVRIRPPQSPPLLPALRIQQQPSQHP